MIRSMSLSIQILLLLLMSFIPLAQADEQKPHEQSSREILDASGVRGGLVVHVGCGDGRFTAELRAKIKEWVEAKVGNIQQGNLSTHIVGTVTEA